MKVSALEIALGTERVRQQAAVKGAGFAQPVLCEQPVRPEEAPFLATNLRGSFLLTPRSRDGVARFAFTECPLGTEGVLVSNLYDALWKISVQQGWSNRCNTLSQAKARMEALGVQPRACIVGLPFLEEAGELTEEDADKLMMFKGYVAEVEGVRALVSGLSAGRAILMASPSQVGDYVRVGDYLGVLICQADRSVVLVGDV